MRIVYGLVTVVVLAFAVLLIRYGVREWRGRNDRPFSRRFGLLVDEGTAAGYDRSGLIMGLGCGFMAMMMGDGLIMNLNDPSRAESLIFAVASAGMIACAGLAFTIIGFNRPKFLVPPHRRDEPGAYGYHRHTKGQHARRLPPG